MLVCLPTAWKRSCCRIHRLATGAGDASLLGDRGPSKTGLIYLEASHKCLACRGALLLQLLDSYAVRYAEMLEGRSEHLPVNELAGGARIRHIFQEIFVSGLNALNPSR